MNSPTDTPTSGRFENREHFLPVRIYYEDTDFSGIVYHANFLKFFERGRSDFLRLMGVNHVKLASGDAPSAFTVARMEIDFRKPAHIDEALLIRTRFTRMKGPRIYFSQRAERDGELLCAAEVLVIPIHMDGRVKRPSQAEIAFWLKYKSEE